MMMMMMMINDPLAEQTMQLPTLNHQKDMVTSESTTSIIYQQQQKKLTWNVIRFQHPSFNARTTIIAWCPLPSGQCKQWKPVLMGFVDKPTENWISLRLLVHGESLCVLSRNRDRESLKGSLSCCCCCYGWWKKKKRKSSHLIWTKMVQGTYAPCNLRSIHRVFKNTTSTPTSRWKKGGDTDHETWFYFPGLIGFVLNRIRPWAFCSGSVHVEFGLVSHPTRK